MPTPPFLSQFFGFSQPKKCTSAPVAETFASQPIQTPLRLTPSAFTSRQEESISSTSPASAT